MYRGFILTRHWRDNNDGVMLELWLATDNRPIQLLIPSQQSVFFIRQQDQVRVEEITSDFPLLSIKPLELKNVHGELLSVVYCLQQRQQKEVCERLKARQLPCWESDIRPVERFLMERFITSSLQIEAANATNSFSHYDQIQSKKIVNSDYQPTLSIVSIDIETSKNAQDLYSIAVYSSEVSLVFMVTEPDQVQADTMPVDGVTIIWCLSPRECLIYFLEWLQECDPDVLIGWHVVQFDCRVLACLSHQWNVPFQLGRAQQVPYWRVEGQGSIDVKNLVTLPLNHRVYMQVPGRVVLDGIELLRTAFYNFSSFSLQTVASELLGQGKLLEKEDRAESIKNLFLSDKVALANYNLQDCRLVWDIFKKTKLLDFAIARSRLTGLALDKMGGSVASFEYAYLPKLHRKGYVSPNLGELKSDVVSPGGYVMRSKPGLYQHVLVLDFKSLYPSIIRTFGIDPLAFWIAKHNDLKKHEVIEGFNGAIFSRKNYILPDVIASLWHERDQAKAVNDQPLSQAIKIIMNSFYGVLGSPGCRFFDPRICSSITLRGHEILQKSHEWIESQGYEVIYGDTDSLFIWLGDGFEESPDNKASRIGHSLADGLNHWWAEKLQKEFDIVSKLEIEFETHYMKFLMPTIRGSQQGSKKRYAGMVLNKGKQELIFKGLETVRNDWTPLAKQFQQQLYEMIFTGQPYVCYIKQLVKDLLLGQYDADLVYSKRLRREVAAYVKSNPPHVKAARYWQLRSGKKLTKGEGVRYLITVNGPEPVEFLQSPIDYHHYIDKQMAPVADSILVFLGDSFRSCTQQQIELL